LEPVFSKLGDGTGENEDDTDEDGKGEVFSLLASAVRGNVRSWIVGDMTEEISFSDVVEQMEATLLASSRESAFTLKATDVDGV
jgi:hypothetical protein